MLLKENCGERVIVSFTAIRRLNVLNIHIAEDFLRKEIGKGIRFLYLDMKGISFIDSYTFSRLLAVNNTANFFCTRFRIFNVSVELEEIFCLLNKNCQIKFVKPSELKIINSLATNVV